MTAFVIEKDVPIHPTYKARLDKYKNYTCGVKMKYPFDKMQVGDSFLVPTRTTRKVVSQAAYSYGARHGHKFVVTYDPDMKIRCWRVE